jgi:hypothetical protein
LDEEKEVLQKKQGTVAHQELEVRERVHNALLSVTVIEVKNEERLPWQVAQLEGVIQQLQKCITNLELRTVPKTPQYIRDLREATACSAVGQIESP